MRKRWIAVSLACAAATFPAIALGAGSATIAGAPPAAPGVLLGGDSASDVTAVGAPCSYGLIGYMLAVDRTEYWRLALATGDEVRISGGASSPVSGVYVCVYPPGTTDAAVAGAPPAAQSQLGQGVELTATAGGSWPVAFDPYWLPGPFSFTVAIHHEALLYMARKVAIGLRAAVRVYVRTPEGNPIADRGLTLRLAGTWRDRPFLPPNSHPLGSAHILAGRATFHLRLPRALAGRSITLIASGEGTGYRPIGAARSQAHVILRGR